jgi:hypothetical protein
LLRYLNPFDRIWRVADLNQVGPCPRHRLRTDVAVAVHGNPPVPDAVSNDKIQRCSLQSQKMFSVVAETTLNNRQSVVCEGPLRVRIERDGDFVFPCSAHGSDRCCVQNLMQPSLPAASPLRSGVQGCPRLGAEMRQYSLPKHRHRSHQGDHSALSNCRSDPRSQK